MKNKKFFLPVAVFFLLVLVSNAARATGVNYTGHYELADKKAAWGFSFDITQTGSKAELSFSAAMEDGSGAAPDGDGKGEVNAKGALAFTFKDSFGNEGTGTLESKGDNYLVKMIVTKVAEPRPLRFYGDTVLKKTASKPSAQ